MAKTVILFIFLVLAAFSLNKSMALDQERDDEITALLERSKATRAEFAKNTPQREVAAINEQDVTRYKEFQKLVDEDNDETPVFGEIDKVIESE